MFKYLQNSKRISIVGLDKNVGKTTVLNKIIQTLANKKIIGLTSIGLDGELQDSITQTSKPKIYVYKNTIVATAQMAIKHSDITKEILSVSNINTPMGNIVFMRALSDGYVLLAGASSRHQMLYSLEYLESMGCDIVLIDGAINRLSIATPPVSDSVILVTGASLSPDIDYVVSETQRVVSFLTMTKNQNENLINDININFLNFKIIFYALEQTHISKCVGLENINLDAIEKYLTKNINVIAMRGAITNTILSRIIKVKDKNNNLEIIAEDGCKFFIDSQMLLLAQKSGINFSVLNEAKLLFVAMNSTSPISIDFDASLFYQKLKNKINYNVIDVMRAFQ